MKGAAGGAGLWALLAAGAFAQPAADPFGPPALPSAVPSPRFERDRLGPAPVLLQVRVSAGVSEDDALAFRGPPGPRRHEAERSYLRLRARNLLDRGWWSEAELEHSVDLASGSPRDAERFFDARSTVSIGSPHFGRIDLGRLEQPAWALARLADPWGGNGNVSPGLRVMPTGRRESGTLNYASPSDRDVRIALQAIRAADGLRGSGGSATWHSGPWTWGAGWHQAGDGTQGRPLLLVHDDGTLRAAAVLTEGRIDGSRYRNLFVGAALPRMLLGLPERQEWRVGFDRLVSDNAGQDGWKAGVGFRHGLSRQTQVLAGAALVNSRERGTQWAAEFGLSVSFERDLRMPQPLR